MVCQYIIFIQHYHSETAPKQWRGGGKKPAKKKNSIYLTVFGKYPNLLNGVGRDGGLEDEEEFVCRLYKSEVVDSGVNKARACIFDQGKVALEMLSPTQNALELHLSYANYQLSSKRGGSKLIKVKMNVNPPSSVLGWQGPAEGIQIVWNRLKSVPSKCVELVTCGCESKCKTAACKCFKSGQWCMGACGCPAEGCPELLHLTMCQRSVL